MPVADLAQPRRNAGGITRTPPSPWIGSIMIAAVSGTIAASTAARSVERNLVEAVDLRTETFEIFLLAARGDGGERAAVKRAFERQDPIALGMAVDPLAPARHLDRGLVGLGAGIGEENEIGEGRVDEAPREPLAFRVLVEVRHVPELRPLSGQRLDQVRMGVSDGGHRDAGAEVEIALARRRDEPAPLSTLEGDIGPRVSRHDR